MRKQLLDLALHRLLPAANAVFFTVGHLNRETTTLSENEKRRRCVSSYKKPSKCVVKCWSELDNYNKKKKRRRLPTATNTGSQISARLKSDVATSAYRVLQHTYLWVYVVVLSFIHKNCKLHQIPIGNQQRTTCSCLATPKRAHTLIDFSNITFACACVCVCAIGKRPVFFILFEIICD